MEADASATVMLISPHKWTEASTKQIIRELQAHLYKVSIGCSDTALVQHLWTMADVLDQYWPGGYARQPLSSLQTGQGPIVGERE